MKSIFFFSLILLRASNGFTQTNQHAATNIVGLYWSPKKDAKIEVYLKEGHYYGRTVWLEKPRKDTENPDQSLRSRDVLGIVLFSHFAYKNGTYVDGEIYDPESGKTYGCKMTLEGDKLNIRGYIGISLFGRTEIFERIK
ncbi:DUF2147 domain-containing protein [soil metagenome]